MDGSGGRSDPRDPRGAVCHVRPRGVWTWCWGGEECTNTRVQETTVWGPREQRRPRRLALDLAGEGPSLGGEPGGREIDLRAAGETLG